MRANQAPRISVVVTAYNRAHYLPETVAAILAQAVPVDEVVVVDDGSTDDTPAVCARFPHPVRTIRQPNGGLVSARNAGLAAVTGDFVAFCDDDDVWHPTKLARQLHAMRATGAAWCVTGAWLIDPEGRRRPEAEQRDHGFPAIFATAKEAGPVRDLFGRWLTPVEPDVFAGDWFGLLCHGNLCLPSSVLLSRAALERVGPFDPTFAVAEETEWFHRLAAREHGAVVLDALVGYRVGHPSIVRRGPEPLIRHAMRSLEQAAKLRPLTPRERAAARSGRRRLLRRLLLARASDLTPPILRRAVRALRG